MVGGIGGLLAAAALAAWLLIVLLKRLPQRGVTWRFGLANLRRRPLASSLQIGALALGLMALLLLTVVRGDLMRNWRASLPPDAPNHFLVNVLPDQVDGVRAALKAATGTDTPLYPMVRGRLVAVNGTRLDTDAVRRYARAAPRRARVQPVVERPICPRTNRIAAGKWFDAARRAPTAGISMEEGIAESLELEARRHADLRYRRHAGHRADHAACARSTGTASGRTSSRCSRRACWSRCRRPTSAPCGCPKAAVGGVALRARPAVSERARDRRRRDHAPGADDHRAGRARGRVRVPVHAARRPAGAAGGDRGDAGRAALRRRDPAHARRVAARSSPPRRSPSFSCWARSPDCSRRPAQRRPATCCPIACSRFRSRRIRSSGCYGIGGGALAVTLAGWLGTRGMMRLPPLAVIRQLGLIAAQLAHFPASTDSREKRRATAPRRDEASAGPAPRTTAAARARGNASPRSARDSSAYWPEIGIQVEPGRLLCAAGTSARSGSATRRTAAPTGWTALP